MSELGDKLRDARLAKGYTIDDLQKITKIQKRYLMAIEEGRLDQLPGDFYIRAFIKQYADSVGLNSTQLLQEFSDEVPQVQPEESPQEQPVVKRDSLLLNLKRRWPQILILAVVLLIVILICLVAVKVHHQSVDPIPTSDQKVEQPKKKSKPKIAKKPKPATSAVKSTKKSQPRTMKITADPNTSDQFVISNWQTDQQHQIQLQATTAQSWISVNADGQNIWQGALNPNNAHKVTLEGSVKEFKIQTGNAPVTKVLIDNQALPVPSDQTGVVHAYTIKIKE
ncbi:DUF4115 domain-containing protein [Bombilactobacillus folatiphilus]|uniref:DUF4115 domain-containing protein n=1 Tax=Bombilactobacillus folatiphilus TaxID=2923362 RepID=A0ABY4P856_9LACO|nr:RodZ domain-containing protein [Bombilactobacillus folatiphilus]UQS81706.1 DUF4115 domain-containing protein [Bombilactobacillus folatiphilus]